MNPTMLIVAVFLLCCIQAYRALPEAERELVDRYKAAYVMLTLSVFGFTLAFFGTM